VIYVTAFCDNNYSSISAFILDKRAKLLLAKQQPNCSLAYIIDVSEFRDPTVIFSGFPPQKAWVEKKPRASPQQV
jgi:hypothetical protein